MTIDNYGEILTAIDSAVNQIRDETGYYFYGFPSRSTKDEPSVVVNDKLSIYNAIDDIDYALGDAFDALDAFAAHEADGVVNADGVTVPIPGYDGYDSIEDAQYCLGNALDTAHEVGCWFAEIAQTLADGEAGGCNGADAEYVAANAENYAARLGALGKRIVEAAS